MAPKRKSTKKVSFSGENPVPEVSTDICDSPNDLVNTEKPLNTTNAANIVIKEKEKETEKEQEKEEENKQELTHVVVQLPISAEHVENILSQDDMCNPFEYNPKLSIPSAYTPVNYFASKNDEFIGDENQCEKRGRLSIQKGNSSKKQIDTEIDAKIEEKNEEKTDTFKTHTCFWCCHPVEHNQFGMPIRYDPIHNNFTFFGTFCSLECCSAYNFSVHMGSDRAWDVQSWIQIMARNYGIPGVIRPAPSRYTLQMFDGPLTIEEFRKAHKGMSKSIMVNIPPLVNMKPQIETINTSFFTTDGSKDSQDTTKKAVLRRKGPATDTRKTLESKMNLSYTSLADAFETTEADTNVEPVSICI